MRFDIRPPEANDAKEIGQMAREFADCLRSPGDEAELKFDANLDGRDAARRAGQSCSVTKAVHPAFKILFLHPIRAGV